MSDLRDRRIAAQGFALGRKQVTRRLAQEAAALKHGSEFPHLRPEIKHPLIEAAALDRVIRDIIKGSSIQPSESAAAIRFADENTK